MNQFQIAISADLITKEDTPCFDEALLKEFTDRPDFSVTILPEGKKDITKQDACTYDALYLMLENLSAESVSTPDLRLKLAARHGVGFDTVDVPVMTSQGIMVTNTPNAVRRPVATMAVTLLLALSHKLIIKHQNTRAGQWARNADHMGVGLTGKTLGVLGAGSIGSEILRMMKPFDMKLIACDPHVGHDYLHSLGAKKVDSDAFFAQADFVIVATSLSAETLHLVNADRLKLMQRHASLINIARGSVIKESDLIHALRSGQISGAALDVFEQEPVSLDNPLLSMDNVITTSHSLCWTDECFDNIARDGLGSIISFADKRMPKFVVDMEVVKHERQVTWFSE
ncbi:MAG: hypothetical protein GWP24_02500 [Alphaproteobacteria bacterium]|nr:hypothetical protein [Alphaproteobacteria bacterium]